MNVKLIIAALAAATALATPALAQPRPKAPQMVTVKGGTFQMGKMVDRGYGQIDGPTREVRVPAFQLAAKEVTLGEFRAFVKATGHVSRGKCNVYENGSGWFIKPERNWESPGFKQGEDHPVVCVSRRDAQAYAAWLGKGYRLPSEAEWEFVTSTAKLGGAKGVTHDVANIGRVECCGGKTEGRDRWIETAPVGSFPRDKLGLYDVRGNVWEWQADCYNDTYVGAPVDGSARTTCPTPGYHAIRGGSYGDAGEFLEERFRLRGPEDQAYFTVGFRVARSLR